MIIQHGYSECTEKQETLVISHFVISIHKNASSIIFLYYKDLNLPARILDSLYENGAAMLASPILTIWGSESISPIISCNF